MKKNMGEIRFTCWIPKATDTHSECVSTATVVCKNAPHCYVLSTLPLVLCKCSVRDGQFGVKVAG